MIVTNLSIDPRCGPVRHELSKAVLSSFDCSVIVTAVRDVVADLYAIAENPGGDVDCDGLVCWLGHSVLTGQRVISSNPLRGYVIGD